MFLTALIIVLTSPNSIPEVQTALANPVIQQVVSDTHKELVDTADKYDTSFDFERDILICEQLHPTVISPDSPLYGYDPQAQPLSDCLNLVISAYDMYDE